MKDTIFWSPILFFNSSVGSKVPLLNYYNLARSNRGRPFIKISAITQPALNISIDYFNSAFLSILSGGEYHLSEAA